MTNSTNLYFTEVLDKNRLTILKNFQFFKEKGYYLAGGTALALQFGHRESIDFDFFINDNIDTNKLFLACLEIFSGFEVKKIFEEINTLYITVNDIKISFFTYKYQNIKPLIDNKFFNIASIEDIGAMKLWAIQNRATNKDYVDLYFIIKKIGVDNLLDSFLKKFGNVVIKTQILKSLIYFDDIKNEKLIMKDSKYSFSFIKKELENIIKNFLKK